MKLLQAELLISAYAFTPPMIEGIEIYTKPFAQGLPEEHRSGADFAEAEVTVVLDAANGTNESVLPLRESEVAQLVRHEETDFVFLFVDINRRAAVFLDAPSVTAGACKR